jgi:ABC-type sugar transport system ATPase subunit
MSTELLRAEHITKHYEGVYALQDASFSLNLGEIHALMGENGAGKSTLSKILAGAARADSGTIFVEGHEVRVANPMDAQRLGIAIIFQELDLFPELTVGENIVIGNVRFGRHRVVNYRQIDVFCRPFLDQVGATCNSRVALGALPIAQQQLVAIARALSQQAKILLMDEPTSSLAYDAVARLFTLVRALKNLGVSIIFVSHKMREIFSICDRITVLRDGVTVGTRVTSETTTNEIITMMVGRELKDATSRPVHSISDKALLTVHGLTTDKIRGMTFALRRGEVLGVAGLAGAGRSELGAALFALDRIKAGSVRVKGQPLNARSPRQAIRSGVGLVPEDRKLEGLMMQMSVLENSTFAVLERLSSWGFLRSSREMEAARSVHGRTRMKAASYGAPVSSLSGGNQQKVLLARWLLVNPDVLFLDDPTRGVDVAAKRDIYEMISELAALAKGVIFVSSELSELLLCCDRIMILHEGRNVGIVEAAQTNQEEIMSLMTGMAAARDLGAEC